MKTTHRKRRALALRCGSAAAAAMLFLGACAARASDSSRGQQPKPPASITFTDKSAAAGSAARSTPSAAQSSTVTARYRDITAYVTAFEDERLSFTYKGKRYSVPFKAEQFAEQLPTDKHRKTVSELVIANKLGEEVRGRLNVSEDMTSVKSCDVITPNGRLFGTGSENSRPDLPQEDYDYSMHRRAGSVCEFVNLDRAFEADLNTLPQMLKENYPQDIPVVEITGYMFTDGRYILTDLCTEYRDTSQGREFSQSNECFSRLTGFFGTVQSASIDRVTMLLDDGITVCSFPSCFTDGEVTEGSRIMAAVCCGSSLYGSGENRVFDYAVIYTTPEDYFPAGGSLSAAYALPLDDGSGDFEAFCAEQ